MKAMQRNATRGVFGWIRSSTVHYPSLERNKIKNLDKSIPSDSIRIESNSNESIVTRESPIIDSLQHKLEQTSALLH